MGRWIGKKQVLLAVLVAALGVAVYLNYYFASQNPLASQTGTSATGETAGKHLGDSLYVGATTGQTEPTSADYFETARRNRKNAREEALEILQDTLQDVTLSEEAQKEALDRVAALTSAVERESALEALILAKGFADCVVYIDGDHCHVVVKAEALDAGQSVQILEIVTTQSRAPAENIDIVAVNS